MPPSFQEILRSRQAGGFIGREQQLALFAENLRLPVADRQFLFSVHGAAGIGKSFLVRQFRRIAVEHGCAAGQVDESAYDLERFPEALADLDRATELLPDYEYGLNLRAVILREMGDR